MANVTERLDSIKGKAGFGEEEKLTETEEILIIALQREGNQQGEVRARDGAVSHSSGDP
jgi:hypothetical protein